MNHKAVIEVNGTQHILTLGLGFLEQLNNKYSLPIDGMPIGALGLPKCLTELKVKNPIVVRDIILFGTMTNVHRPSEQEIEEWICEQMEDEATETKMFDDFFDYLKLVPGAKKFAKAMEEQQALQLEEAPKPKKKTTTKK
ncbi:tail assembly chaperone [Aerococcaceae bacterium NML130460]|nr:tail assembly chaperone [Aerococcaceae bacterium NML130460]